MSSGHIVTAADVLDKLQSLGLAEVGEWSPPLPSFASQARVYMDFDPLGHR